MSFLSKKLSCAIAAAIFMVSFQMKGEDLLAQPLEKMTVEAFSASAWTDHTLAFEEVFKVVPVDSMLEFGLGLSTKIFLEKVPSVASLELGCSQTLQPSLDWYQRCVKRFMPVYKHWKPSFRMCGNDVDVYTTNAYQKKVFPETLSKAYLQEIADTCSQGLSLLNGNCILAFVDSGVYGRADLVQELLSRKIPIVAAHDTIADGWEGNYYGYNRIDPPSEYISITFPVRRKITFWIRKDMYSGTTIEDLKHAADRMVALQCLRS